MSITSFSIKSRILNYELTLERRITIITGDSATGKTTMVQLLKDSEKQPTIEVSSTRPIYCVTPKRSITDLLNSNGVIIVLDEDELDDRETILKITDSCVSNDNYFVIMYRTAPTEDINLHFAVKSYQKLINYDGVYRNVPRFNISLPVNIPTIDYVVTEDSKAGYIFLKEMFPRVISAKGNGNIVSEVQKLSGNVLVFADLANFGEHFIEFSLLNSDTENLNAWLIPDYECFEELLLRSNVLNKNNVVVEHFKEPWLLANNYKTWEKFYEDFIYSLTKNTNYIVDHTSGKFSKCWYSSCGTSKFCNSYLQAKCSQSISGNKLYEILKGTKYEYIYHLLLYNR